MWIIGIDLGTTHSAMAAVEPGDGRTAPVVDVPVPQLVRPGAVESRPLLPSVVYLPAEWELTGGALALPWGGSGPRVVGELARWQGTQSPGRVVASAKSWLCHPGVDRSAPILPWAAPEDVAKLSPVEASTEVLRHLREAWDAAHPEAPLAAQEVVLTVPASFDEAARALTVNAAKAAGFGAFRLLEEPQAAFYDFTARHRDDLARALEDIRLVLVVDVGGGTTDFTLVHVGVSPEGPLLRRLAVGEHLMLGGDNMDAALAHALEEKVKERGQRLSPTQWSQAVQAARTAKEALLGERAPEGQIVSLAPSGGRLVGGAVSVELSRGLAEALVLDGFFPKVSPADLPRSKGRAGLQELGLPYAQEPAVTRHLVGFLSSHARAGFAALGMSDPKGGALPRPDAILLNGGVFNSRPIAARLVEAVSGLWPDAPPIPLLAHESLERAVARGAAYSGLVRRGMGLRIGGGAARAFYVGVEGRGGGDKAAALTLIPRGSEEGEVVKLTDQPFRLTLGRPVQFQLYSSTQDRVDAPGALVPVTEELLPLPPIHTLLKGAGAHAGEVPVHLEAALTEIGTLELYAVSQAGDERWRLEFELRGAAQRGELTVTESMPARFAEAREDIERVFGHRPMPLGSKDVKQLFRGLEKSLGPRETWRLPVLRELFGALFSGAAKRRRSPDHERVFFQLLGFTLRPGFGYPLDAWRAEQAFGLFKDLVQFHAEKPNWIEFWVMWRRVAGGLQPPQQEELFGYLKPHLERRLLPEAKRAPQKLKGVQPEGLDEMVRTAAALEHLPREEKTLLGGWIAGRLEAESEGGGPWGWALGRLGARSPAYGSAHRVVPPEVAERWMDVLCRRGLKAVDGAPFAVAQLARLTGDRARDLRDDARAKAVQALRSVSAPESFVRLITDVAVLEAADEARVLGDTLPAGLRLE